MQRSLSQTIERINNLPDGIGDNIWKFYYQTGVQNFIETTQKNCIEEFKNLISSTINQVDYDKFKKNKTFIKSTLEKKDKPVNQCIGSVFHPQHKKYCSHTHYGGKKLTSLDIFVGDMEEKFLVYTLAYKDRLLIRFQCQHVWKNTPKKNFIIKYLLYTYTQQYWMDNTCNGIIKSSGSRCNCWLQPNCLHIRCSRHKFSQVSV